MYHVPALAPLAAENTRYALRHCIVVPVLPRSTYMLRKVIRVNVLDKADRLLSPKHKEACLKVKMIGSIHKTALLPEVS